MKKQGVIPMTQNQITVSKRGQATIFILLGIVLVILVSIYFLSQSEALSGFFEELTTSTRTETLEQAEMREKINECLEEYAKQGLELLQTQGGYMSLSRDSLTIDGKSLGILASKGKLYVSLSSMEEELSTSVQKNVEEHCLENEKKYKIDQKGLEIETEFEEGELVIEADWVLQFRNLDDPTNIFSLDSFAVALETHMFELYEEAEHIVEEGMSYNTQYYAESTINRTQILHEEANITILSLEEEYFIIAIKN